MWEICTQEIPVRGQMRPVSVPEECPQEIKDLMWLCTEADPNVRPDMRSIIAILQHHQ